VAITKGTAVATSGNLTTGFTLVVPAAVVANDIIVVGITNRDATTNPTCVDNEGAGAWARITTVNAATNGSISIWWKRASANTNSKTVTVGSCTGSASGALMYYRGASLAANPFGTPVGEANASADVSQAGITTSRAGSMVIHLVGCTSNDTLNPTNRSATTPSAIAEDAEGVSAGGSDCSLSFASAERAAAGATGTISWTQTNGTGASLAIELLPAWVPLTADSGAFAFSGTDATLKQGHKIAADSGAFAFTGTAATLRRNFPLTASSGSFAFTGTAVALKRSTIMPAASGAFAFTGSTAALKQGHAIAASSGAFPFAGTAADLVYTPSSGATLTADSGSFAFTGTVATLKVGHLVAADSGAFAFTGTAAALKVGHSLAASSGSFAFTGSDAALKQGHLLAATSGAFAFAGQAAAIKVGHRLSALVGAFAFSGQDATLVYGTPNRVLPAGSGSFAFTGQTALLARGYTMAAGSGAFPFAGATAAFLRARILLAESAAFGFAGSSAALSVGTPASVVYTATLREIGARFAALTSTDRHAVLAELGPLTATLTEEP
jgi:hypothetical protein